MAVCTKHFAVGAMVPHAASRVGAVATQAETNPLLGVRALAMMRAGIPAGQALIKALQASDAEFDLRQVHVVDSHGRAVAWTGRQCVDWAGHHTLDDVFASVAGNMLAGPQVLEAMATAFRRVSSPEALAKASPLPLAERLVAALAAGQAAGGDKRGQQSAAVIVYRDQAYTTVDIRVDDHRGAWHVEGRAGGRGCGFARCLIYLWARVRAMFVCLPSHSFRSTGGRVAATDARA